MRADVFFLLAHLQRKQAKSFSHLLKKFQYPFNGCHSPDFREGFIKAKHLKVLELTPQELYFERKSHNLFYMLLKEIIEGDREFKLRLKKKQILPFVTDYQASEANSKLNPLLSDWMIHLLHAFNQRRDP